MTMPFSSSSFFLFSPSYFFHSKIINKNSIRQATKSWKTSMRPVYAPCGIQVARTESLRFRLLKAVLIPITIKYFLFFVDSATLWSSDMRESFNTDSWAALAAANSISRFEIVLSSVLHSIYGNKLSAQITR